MRQAELELGDGIRCSGDGVVAIALQVRIVDAGGSNANTGHFEFAAHVGHVQPSTFGERGPQIAPGEGIPGDALVLVEDVAQWILRFRSEVVVAAEDEQTWPSQQIAERLDTAGTLR